MQTARVIVAYPEHEMLEIEATGEGSSRRIATMRAIRKALESPLMKHKSPNYILIEVVTDTSMAMIRDLPTLEELEREREPPPPTPDLSIPGHRRSGWWWRRRR